MLQSGLRIAYRGILSSRKLFAGCQTRRNLSHPIRRFMIMRLMTDEEREMETVDSDAVFADPVSYLASFGIDARLISNRSDLAEAA